MNKMRLNELITLTRIDDTTLYVNINHIAAFYHNKSWEYTVVILSDGTQLDAKDSVESIAKYFSRKNQRIPIIATNLKTGEPQEFYGVRECARQLRIDHSSIIQVIKGKRRQAGGYRFKYKEEIK